MTFIRLENLQSPGLVLNHPLEPVAKIIRATSEDEIQLLLHHHAAEQIRHNAHIWEQIQFLIGALLFAFLYMASQQRILPLALCGIMVALTLFQYVGVTPELAYRGRETDFPPGSNDFASLARVWQLNQILVGTEMSKLVIGGILASYLFVFHASRKRSGRRELDDIDTPGLSARYHGEIDS